MSRKIISITLKVFDEDVTSFENQLKEKFEIISFRIMPNTEELYNTDTRFQTLVKNVKRAKEIRDNYINEHNNP